MTFQGKEYYENQGTMVLQGRDRIDPSNEEIRGMVSALCKRVSNGLVLNIGVGPLPQIDIQLLNRGCRVIGVDIARSFLTIAQNEFRNHGYAPPLLVADAIALPFQDQTFDFCVCSEVIEHLRDAAMLLRESNRVLKKGGYLVVTTPTRKNLFKTLASFSFQRGGVPFEENESHVKEYTYDELRLLLRESFRLRFFTHTNVFISSARCSFLEAPLAKCANFLVSLPYMGRFASYIGFLCERI